MLARLQERSFDIDSGDLPSAGFNVTRCAANCLVQRVRFAVKSNPRFVALVRHVIVALPSRKCVTLVQIVDHSVESESEFVNQRLAPALVLTGIDRIWDSRCVRFGALNRLAEYDPRGLVLGSTEFHRCGRAAQLL